MDQKLFTEAIIKFLCGVMLVGLLIFLPAGTLAFPCALWFMALLFVPMFLAGVVMMLKAPALLKSRLDAKEKEMTQKRVIALSGLMFVLGFALCGLNFRFGWTHLPAWLVVLARIIFLLSYGLFALVLKQNAYLSRTIKVQEGQQVIDTGLYGIVRHPMYSASVLLFLSMPLVLDCLPAFFLFCIYPFLIAKRIQNEEAVLEKELMGYTQYKQKVKYRLIPFIW